MVCRARLLSGEPPIQNLVRRPLQSCGSTEVSLSQSAHNAGNNAPSSVQVNRRALLFGAVFLVGGAAALTRFARDSRPDGAASVLPGAQFALLEIVTDVMIPATDTPGALAAGVPAFVRGMLDEWASVATRAEILGVLEAIEKSAWVRRGASFNQLPPDQRHEVLSDFDAAAIVREDEPYRKFKFLVMAGYYHSEIGATQELRYELVPGTWRSCLPLRRDRPRVGCLNADAHEFRRHRRRFRDQRRLGREGAVRARPEDAGASNAAATSSTAPTTRISRRPGKCRIAAWCRRTRSPSTTRSRASVTPSTRRPNNGGCATASIRMSRRRTGRSPGSAVITWAAARSPGDARPIA